MPSVIVVADFSATDSTAYSGVTSSHCGFVIPFATLVDTRACAAMLPSLTVCPLAMVMGASVKNETVVVLSTTTANSVPVGMV